MDADKISKEIRQELINSGFRGIIDLDEARKVVDKVIKKHKNTAYQIIVEFSPIHRVGRGMQCDCARSIIRVGLKK